MRMPVFRVRLARGEDRVTTADSLEDAKELDGDTVERLTALEVLEQICADLYCGDYGDDLADELYPAMQQFSDTVTDLKRRNPGAFSGDDPAGRLWDAVYTFLSGRWEDYR
jgi:hypothetical protein